MLSTRTVSVNVLIHTQDFLLLPDQIASDLPAQDRVRYPLVHGSFMFEMYAKVRTRAGRILYIKAVAAARGNSTSTSFAEEASSLPLAMMATDETRAIEGIVVTTKLGVTTIETALWVITFTAIRSARAYFMNVALEPKRPLAIFPVVPHGILGACAPPLSPVARYA